MNNASSIRQPRRVLKYSASLLAAALLAYATFIVSQSWREAKSDQSSQLATIADLSEIAVDSYFTQLEIGMRNLGADLLDMDGKFDPDRAFKLVNRFQALHAELGNVVLMRGDGRILLTGQVPHRSDLPTLADEPSFIQFRTELLQDSPFVIGQPVMGHVGHDWVSAVRLAVIDSSGKLVYVLSANLPGTLLHRFHSGSANPMITAMGLVRDDGYLVNHYPEPDAASQRDVYGKPVDGPMAEYLSMHDHPQRGEIEIPGSDGRTIGLRALRRLQHYPVTLFVEMPMSQIKAAWWEEMHAPYFLMALLLAGTFGIYGLRLHRRRVWSDAERREALRKRYEQTLYEGGPNEILIVDSGTLNITHANDAALENLGYSLEDLQQKTLLSLHPQMSIEIFSAMIEPLRRGEQTAVTYQTTQARADGSTYPVDVDLQLLEQNGGGGFMAVINDLTEFRVAEENLREFNAPAERRDGERN